MKEYDQSKYYMCLHYICAYMALGKNNKETTKKIFFPFFHYPSYFPQTTISFFKYKKVLLYVQPVKREDLQKVSISSAYSIPIVP